MVVVVVMMVWIEYSIVGPRRKKQEKPARDKWNKETLLLWERKKEGKGVSIACCCDGGDDESGWWWLVRAEGLYRQQQHMAIIHHQQTDRQSQSASQSSASHSEVEGQ